MKYNRHLIKDFDQCQRDSPNRPVLMSEGDSWFSYSNIIGRLDEVGNSQRAWSRPRSTRWRHMSPCRSILNSPFVINVVGPALPSHETPPTSLVLKTA